MRIHTILTPDSSCIKLRRPGFVLNAFYARSLRVRIVSFLLGALFAGTCIFAAQTSSAPQQPASAATTLIRAHKKTASTTPAAAQSPQIAPEPVAPPLPDWPANDHPQAASVIWDSHGLCVVASNSSLVQILKEVSLDTGIKVEGISKDERVFGTYGPAPARDVLSQLLDGSSYDVIMVGDMGQGTPRRVVLTAHSGNTPPANNTNASQPADQDNGTDEVEQQSEEAPPEQPQTQQAQPPPNGFAPGVPYRTQQQLIEEMQERQRQFQQQQQQNPQ